MPCGKEYLTGFPLIRNRPRRELKIPNRLPRATRRVLPLAILFLVTGSAHFVIPEWFDRIVPRWVPDARMATLLSGAAELAGAVGLCIPALRQAAGWGLIALLCAVFPANVQMLLMAIRENAGTWSHSWYVVTLWARLPLQALLIWWVWRAAVQHSASSTENVYDIFGTTNSSSR